MPDKTQQTETGYLALKPNYDLRLLIRDAIKHSPDAIVRKQGRTWFPRLIAAALTVYVAHLLSTKEGAQ